MTKLLAIYEAVKHFRHMLEARQFTILTDHKPLTFTFHQKRDKCSPRQFNQLDFISQFTTDIRHISEQDNIVADTLSRVEVIATSVTHDALAAAQVDDDELQTLLVTQLYSLQKSSFPVPQSNCTAIYLLANHDHTSHLLSAVKYLVPYILSATPELKQRLSSFPNALCGQPFKKTAALGPELANTASAPKYLATSSLQLATSPSLLPAFYTVISTWSAHYLPQKDFTTASPL